MEQQTDEIRQINFEQVKDLSEMEYMDEGIAFHTNIREIPVEKETLRVNMYTIVACINGRGQVELNASSFILQQNEIIVFRPNDVVGNYMISPDFNAAVFCLSERGILEQLSESDFWDKAFRLAENPVIRIGEQGLRLFRLYGEILMVKTKMRGTPYYRETIVSIVKASLYELLGNIDTQQSPAYGSGLVRQREVQFKRFIDLLARTRVKPRTVGWYADQLCITPKYLSTVSKKVSGRTAFDWINEYVLVDVRHYLKNSNKSIKEIADLLGFPNLSFFGKYCRTHFGVSPTEYRKCLRNEQKA